MKKGAMSKGPVTLEIAAEYLRLGVVEHRFRKPGEKKPNKRWLRSLEVAHTVLANAVREKEGTIKTRCQIAHLED
jgi:hypothetical protein